MSTIKIARLVLPGDMVQRQSADDVRELAGSLALRGMLHPVVVRRGTNELVCGRNRVAAAMRLSWDEVPCTFVEGDLFDVKEMEISENLHRRQEDRAALMAAYAKAIAERTAAHGAQGQDEETAGIKGDTCPSKLTSETIEPDNSELGPDDGPKLRDELGPDDGPKIPPRKRGRPKTAKGIAREEVARAAGVSPKRVKNAEFEVKRREREAAALPAPKPRVLRTLGLEVPDWVEDRAAQVHALLTEIDNRARADQAALKKLHEAGCLTRARYQRLKESLQGHACGARRSRPACVCPDCKLLPGRLDRCEFCGGLGWASEEQVELVAPESMREGADAGVFVDGRFVKLSELGGDDDESPF